MIGEGGLRIDVSDGVATLTLDRPDAHNAIDGPLHRALETVWAALAPRDDVRAVVLTGAGRSFSAGGNLEGFRQMVEDREHRRFTMDSGRALADAIAGFGKPVVAAVNGPAVGLGATIVGLCDIVLMAQERAYLADTHVSIGIVSGDGATSSWPLMAGLLRAKEKILLGERIDAATAVSIGLATRAVPDADLQAEARAVAAKLAAQPAQALQDTKRALNLHLQTAMQAIMPSSLAWEEASFDAPEVRTFLDRHSR